MAINWQRLLTFDRVDFAVTKVVIAGAAAAPLAGVYGVLQPWLAGEPLVTTVPTGSMSPLDSAATLRPGVSAEHTGELLVRLPDAATGLWVSQLIASVWVAVIVWAVLWQLWRVLASIQRGEPFSRGVVARLRWMATYLIVAPWVLLALNGWVTGQVSAAAFTDDQPLKFVLSLGTEFAVTATGLLIAAIAEAFVRGEQLQADTEGLV